MRSHRASRWRLSEDSHFVYVRCDLCVLQLMFRFRVNVEGFRSRYFKLSGGDKHCVIHPVIIRLAIYVCLQCGTPSLILRISFMRMTRNSCFSVILCIVYRSSCSKVNGLEKCGGLPRSFSFGLNLFEMLLNNTNIFATKHICDISLN